MRQRLLADDGADGPSTSSTVAFGNTTTFGSTARSGLGGLSRANSRGVSRAPSYANLTGLEQDEDEIKIMQRRMAQSSWTLDRGAGYYHKERVKNNRASLVQTGRCDAVRCGGRRW